MAHFNVYLIIQICNDNIISFIDEMTTLLKIKSFKYIETSLGTILDSTVYFKDTKHGLALNLLDPLNNFTLHIYLLKLNNSTSFRFKLMCLKT